MTEKRWQIVGGLAFAYATVWVMYEQTHLEWWTYPLGVGLAAIGYAVGSHLVRRWQEAGR